MFAGFEEKLICVSGEKIHVRIGGKGRPLLFLHGYPQTSATWGKVADRFAEHFTCIIADLPGYGRSSIPPFDGEQAHYSKRGMANLLVDCMSELGFERFSVLGHDRGARVAYRMAFDHPERVEKLGIVEVVPTALMWDHFNDRMSFSAYHWTFLAQPHPLPETMIGANPEFYLDWTLKVWTQDKSLDAFDPDALAEYRRAATQADRIRAWCEDYRAGYTIDRELDEADRKAGRKIKAPLHFLYTSHGFPAQTGNPLELWRAWAETVTGSQTEAGHFVQEENPDSVVENFVPFFAS